MHFFLKIFDIFKRNGNMFWEINNVKTVPKLTNKKKLYIIFTVSYNSYIVYLGGVPSAVSPQLYFQWNLATFWVEEIHVCLLTI